MCFYCDLPGIDKYPEEANLTWGLPKDGFGLRTQCLQDSIYYNKDGWKTEGEVSTMVGGTETLSSSCLIKFVPANKKKKFFLCIEYLRVYSCEQSI